MAAVPPTRASIFLNHLQLGGPRGFPVAAANVPVPLVSFLPNLHLSNSILPTTDPNGANDVLRVVDYLFARKITPLPLSHSTLFPTDASRVNFQFNTFMTESVRHQRQLLMLPPSENISPHYVLSEQINSFVLFQLNNLGQVEGAISHKSDDQIDIHIRDPNGLPLPHSFVILFFRTYKATIPLFPNDEIFLMDKFTTDEGTLNDAVDEFLVELKCDSPQRISHLTRIHITRHAIVPSTAADITGDIASAVALAEGATDAAATAAGTAATAAFIAAAAAAAAGGAPPAAVPIAVVTLPRMGIAPDRLTTSQQFSNVILRESFMVTGKQMLTAYRQGEECRVLVGESSGNGKSFVLLCLFSLFLGFNIPVVYIPAGDEWAQNAMKENSIFVYSHFIHHVIIGLRPWWNLPLSIFIGSLSHNPDGPGVPLFMKLFTLKHFFGFCLKTPSSHPKLAVRLYNIIERFKHHLIVMVDRQNSIWSSYKARLPCPPFISLWLFSHDFPCQILCGSGNSSYRREAAKKGAYFTTVGQFTPAEYKIFVSGGNAVGGVGAGPRIDANDSSLFGTLSGRSPEQLRLLCETTGANTSERIEKYQNESLNLFRGQFEKYLNEIKEDEVNELFFILHSRTMDCTAQSLMDQSFFNAEEEFIDDRICRIVSPITPSIGIFMEAALLAKIQCRGALFDNSLSFFFSEAVTTHRGFAFQRAIALGLYVAGQRRDAQLVVRTPSGEVDSHRIPFCVAHTAVPNNLSDILPTDSYQNILVDFAKPNYPYVDHVLLTPNHILFIHDTIEVDPLKVHSHPQRLFDVMPNQYIKGLAGSPTPPNYLSDNAAAPSPVLHSLCNAIYSTLSPQKWQPVAGWNDLVTGRFRFGPTWVPLSTHVTPIYLVICRVWARHYKKVNWRSPYVRVMTLEDLVASNIISERAARRMGL